MILIGCDDGADERVSHDIPLPEAVKRNSSSPREGMQSLNEATRLTFVEIDLRRVTCDNASRLDAYPR